MKVRYITIEREYGSGGTETAKLLSEQTGIPCYGMEIIKAASEKLGKSISEIQDQEESTTNSFLYTMYLMGKARSGDSTMLSSEGAVFVAEQEAIRNFAAKGSTIFVGHCASESLKGFQNVVKVFIRCSDNSLKNSRITEKYGIPSEKAEATRKKFDNKRAHYYQCNTGEQWNDLTRYNIVLDSGIIGIEGCAAALKGLLDMN